ncbi:MAG: hypothetical protein MUO64_10345, partial [Anaerolineales bacterium]|nr:hypothetical protein [Anaerolineales bacterium]
MNTKSEISPTENRPNLAAGILMRVGTVAIFFILIAAILFLSVGRLNWTWAWVYLGICLVSLIINASIMFRTSPETIAE